MAATNLAVHQSDHAEKMARFASEAIVEASETPIDEEDPSKGYVEIRV